MLMSTIYNRLSSHFGPQRWWPAESEEEMMIGAILTQSVSWKNVEVSLIRLKKKGLLSLKALYEADISCIAECIRPSGYFNQKAKKLHILASYFKTFEFQYDRCFSRPLAVIRQELLSLWGIGPETADSILLYAAEKPVFVIDAYTKRLFKRLGLGPISDTYDAWQELFMAQLPLDVRLYNEYHALIVALGKDVCRPTPCCNICTLSSDCPRFGVV